MADVSARFNITADDKTKAAFASVNNSLKTLHTTLKTALGFAGIGTGIYGIGQLVRELNRLSDYATQRGLPDTTRAVRELHRVLEDGKVQIDAYADWWATAWVKIKTGAAEAAIGIANIGKETPGATYAPGHITSGVLQAFDPRQPATIGAGSRGGAGNDPATTARLYAAALDKLGTIETSLLSPEKKHNDLLNEQLGILSDLLQKYPEQADRINAVIEKIRQTKEIEAANEAWKEYRIQLELAAEAQDRVAKSAADMKAIIDEGAAAALEQANVQIGDEADRLGAKLTKEFTDWQAPAMKAVDTLTGAIDQAFSDMINTGSFSFKKLGDYLLAEIAHGIIHKALADLGKSLKDALSKSGSSGSGGGGFLGSIFSGIASLFGFAKGGSFEVGGSGGTDSQLVAFRATPGEQVSVGYGLGRQGTGVVVNNSYDLRGVTKDNAGDTLRLIESERGKTLQAVRDMLDRQYRVGAAS